GRPGADPRQRGAQGLLAVETAGEPAAVQGGRKASPPAPPLLTHHLGKGCDRLRAPGPAAWPERVEQHEAVADQHPTGGGRRIRDELVAPVARANRPPPHDPVGGEVVTADHAAGLVQVPNELPPELAAVERARAVLREQLERTAEVVEHQAPTCGQPPAARPAAP